METYERIIAADQGGIYESNYLKGNDPDGNGAFWLKHNILSPAEGQGFPAVAELWGVVWLDDWRPRVWKAVVPLADVALSGTEVAIDAGDVRLEPGRAVGRIERAGSSLSWDLTLVDELPPLLHLSSAWMYDRPFPRKKLVTPSPRVVFDGTIVVDGHVVDVDGWVGHRNHNWGTEHALRYVYGSCNVWDQDVDLTVEGFTVQVRLVGPLRSPPLTLIRGLRDGIVYGRGTVGAMLSNHGAMAWPEWTAYGGRRGGGRTRLEMTLEPDHVAGLRYLHPSGEVSYCYNAKDARVVLLLDRERYTSGSGELEFLVPEPIDGIPLHGHASVAELEHDL